MVFLCPMSLDTTTPSAFYMGTNSCFPLGQTHTSKQIFFVIIFRVKDDVSIDVLPCHQVSCLPAALLHRNKYELAANTWSSDVASCKEKISLLVAIMCNTCFWLPFAKLMHYLRSLSLNWHCLCHAMHMKMLLCGWFLLKFDKISVRNKVPGC